MHKIKTFFQAWKTYLEPAQDWETKLKETETRKKIPQSAENWKTQHGHHRRRYVNVQRHFVERRTLYIRLKLNRPFTEYRKKTAFEINF